MTMRRILARAGVVAAGAAMVAFGSTTTALAATPEVQAAPTGGYGTTTYTACVNYLETWGYEVNSDMHASCAVAQALGGATGIFACTGGLLGAGVRAREAGPACVLGAAPA